MKKELRKSIPYIVIVILLLFYGVMKGQQYYTIISDPVCWQVSGVDSTLNRYTYITQMGNIYRVVYLNQSGEVVSAVGGNFRAGYCECCNIEDAIFPPPFSVSAESASQPVQNPLNPLDSCCTTLVFSVQSEFSDNVIITTINGDTIPNTFNPATLQGTATDCNAWGSGTYQWVVELSSVTAAQTVSDTSSTVTCGVP